MGSKNCMLAFSTGDAREILATYPVLDREATVQAVADAFPDRAYDLVGEADLGFCYPSGEEVLAACYPGLTIFGTNEVGIDYPSQLPERFLEFAGGRRIVLHAMHSVASWFAYAVWEGSEVTRSLSLSHDSDVQENIGEPLPFEVPYWAGAHAYEDELEPGEEPMNSFDFSPMELGEDALLALFGFQQEGVIDSSHLDTNRLPLLRFVPRTDAPSARPSPRAQTGTPWAGWLARLLRG